MPLSQAHKQRSREKILDSALALFTARGFNNVSIDDVMNNADLTRGTFYAHFSSKSELYKESILSAALNTDLAQEQPDNVEHQQRINKLLDGYLSIGHVNRECSPCPISFLAIDTAVAELEVRDAYTTTFKNMNKRILHLTKSFSSCNDDQVLAITAMMVGGVTIARALNDEALKEKLLKSCREISREILEDVTTC